MLKMKMKGIIQDDEAGILLLMEQGDEDALLVSEFEDQLIEACQDNVDLSMCFSAYTEARGRVRDKIRARGFWPPVKGKGKHKGGKKSSWKGGPRKEAVGSLTRTAVYVGPKAIGGKSVLTKGMQETPMPLLRRSTCPPSLERPMATRNLRWWKSYPFPLNMPYQSGGP